MLGQPQLSFLLCARPHVRVMFSLSKGIMRLHTSAHAFPSLQADGVPAFRGGSWSCSPVRVHSGRAGTVPTPASCGDTFLRAHLRLLKANSGTPFSAEKPGAAVLLAAALGGCTCVSTSAVSLEADPLPKRRFPTACRAEVGTLRR